MSTPKRWHCAGCNRLLPKAGVSTGHGEDGFWASYHGGPDGISGCPNCGEHEVYGSGWPS